MSSHETVEQRNKRLAYYQDYARKNRERIQQQRQEYRIRNKDKIAAANREQYQKNREARKYIQRVKHTSRKAEMLALHGTEACPCGESRPWCLCFHHRDAKAKEFSISLNTYRPNDDLIEELNKCDVLCHNCHANLHYEEN